MVLDLECIQQNSGFIHDSMISGIAPDKAQGNTHHDKSPALPPICYISIL